MALGEVHKGRPRVRPFRVRNRQVLAGTGCRITQAPWGGLKIDLSAVRREKKLDGKWVITSNDDTLSAEDLALGYKQLMRVEQCWHTVKGGLRTRPIFHWTPHSSEE